MRQRTNRGFTLVELMVAVALMVILIGIVVYVFAQSTAVFNKADSRTQIYQNARTAIDKIEESLISALPITHTDQHFYLFNMFTNSPEVAGTCPPADNDTGCIFNQGDAMFFYGTTYINGEPKTGYILYRMGNYDADSDSYLLKVFIIPRENILPDGRLHNTTNLPADPNGPYDTGELGDFSEAMAGRTVYVGELCQYVRAVRIKFMYSDAWRNEIDEDVYPKAAGLPEFQNLLPYATPDPGAPVNLDYENCYEGDIGDNDAYVVSSLEWPPMDHRNTALQQNLITLNRGRYIKKDETSYCAAGQNQPWHSTEGWEAIGPFWHQSSQGNPLDQLDSGAAAWAEKPMKKRLLFEDILNPLEGSLGEGGSLFRTFRDKGVPGFIGRGDNGDQPYDDKVSLIRFKVPDLNWQLPTAVPAAPTDYHPLEYDADGDGKPDYPGNAYRVKGVAVDGSDSWICKPLPSAIEITLRVVDLFRRDTRIISKVIYLPVH